MILDPLSRWVSDHGLLLAFGGESSNSVRERVLGAIEALRRAEIPGLRNLHPAFASILVVCDPRAVSPEAFEAAVRRALSDRGAPQALPRRLVEVPVCYEPECGPDLEDVARSHGLSVAEAVRLHSAAEYVVAFLGFTPGFPYMAGLPEALATPRLATPRKQVPAGSVAIGGSQAGIYPFATPGGWRLVGRTPLELFRVDRDPPALLLPGDRVRFVAISLDAFRRSAERQA
jgi:inhibitor of KinA